MGFVNVAPDVFETRLKGKSIDSIASRGKWIFVKLQPSMNLVLGEIIGKVLYHAPEDAPLDRFNLRLQFTDNSRLTVSISFYGFILAVTDAEREDRRYPGRLGVSPVDDEEFTFERFRRILHENTGKMAKYVLLEQKSIAGIGNGYLQDILLKAKIHPKRKANEIDKGEERALFTAAKETLKEAVRLGGSELERDLFDKPGGYRRILGEHMKGRACPFCGTPIEKLNILGSSSYVCPSCQKTT
jgi:formamidopyrimidine-DNA glycosylase